MTRFLASVRDPTEVELVLGAGADIVDLKDPTKGALGAVDLETVKACVTAVGGRAPVSATVGDLPMDADRVHGTVVATAACGVDDVKLGILPGGDPQTCLARLRSDPPRTGLILVVFVDALPGFDPIAAALEAGARGVMLDTAGKGTGALLDHMSIGDVSTFVEAAHGAGLIVGVAGALRASHVASLMVLRPDVMGFRGALCHGAQRSGDLDPAACRRIRALIPARMAKPEAEMEAPPVTAVC